VTSCREKGRRETPQHDRFPRLPRPDCFGVRLRRTDSTLRADGGPLDPDGFTHGFGRIAKAAGVDGVRLHDRRHGVATALAKAGTPAYVTSKVLGHSSVHFTANTYQHADEETVDRALAGLEQAFGQDSVPTA
jgi:integrase